MQHPDLSRLDVTSATVLLWGSWHLVMTQGPVEVGPGIELEFHPDGTLLCAVRSGRLWRTSRFVYRVKGERLVATLPPDGRIVGATMALETEDSLRLDGPTGSAWFQRGSRRQPVRGPDRSRG
jgi:hypothetical protein